MFKTGMWFSIPEPVPTGGVRGVGMVAVATRVRDFELLHNILLLFKIKRQVFLNLFTRSTSLPAGVLGLGKMWAPGSGLQRGWGRRGSRRLGPAVPAGRAGFRIVACLGRPVAGRCSYCRPLGWGASSRCLWFWWQAPFPVGVLGLRKGWALAGLRSAFLS